MRCPLCNTELPDDAAQCTRCDWVRKPRLPRSRALDWRAAALSFVPGLGHLYKGHLIPGLILLIAAGPAFLCAVILLIPATFGFSLILPAVFVGFTAAHAFQLQDVRQVPGVRAHAVQTLARWSRRIG